MRTYKFTEASAIEILEDICDDLSKYKIHKDKEGIARFQPEESLTMATLKQLNQRGVKVELGMPYEMWDSQSAEIVELRQHCELIIAEYEDELIEWMLNKQKDPLQNFLCRFRFLLGKDHSCLPLPATDEL